MAYYTRVLQPGEDVHCIGRLHPSIYWGGLTICFIATIAALLGMRSEIAGPILAVCGFFFLVGIVALIKASIRRSSTEMVVTDRRVIYKIGLLSRRTMEMNIGKIETVDVEQGLLGRIFGYGTVLIRGTVSTFEPLRSVQDPLVLRNAILVG